MVALNVVRKKGVERWEGTTCNWQKTSRAATSIVSVWERRERGVRDAAVEGVRDVEDLEGVRDVVCREGGPQEKGPQDSRGPRNVVGQNEVDCFADVTGINNGTDEELGGKNLRKRRVGKDDAVLDHGSEREAGGRVAGKLWHRRERGLGCVNDQETRDREQRVPGGRSGIGDSEENVA